MPEALPVVNPVKYSASASNIIKALLPTLASALSIVSTTLDPYSLFFGNL